MVFFGGRRLKEMVAGKIAPHKERVRSGKIASDDAVAFVAAEFDERLETRTEEI